MKVVKNAGQIFDIELEEDLLQRNRELALENRKLLDSHGVLAVDIMGSVGSGKTSLIEQMVSCLKARYRIAAIAGDLTTTIDAERIKGRGAEVVEVNTGKECHLDANLVRKAIEELELETIDLLFIENVGNLICPADFPLGSHRRIVVTSVTEGPYMVIKHPHIFAEADAVAINKVDLSQAMGVEPEKLQEDALSINPALRVVRTNCLTGEGVEDVIELLVNWFIGKR
ncbi:MAG TPA: hydrogenase nickel incorporation protein HypB [Candidatus Latescibacteria bacterium]|nr:hydrogenase nickel incorporation protein HypB [Candidatus Latescibacterota bacterium]